MSWRTDLAHAAPRHPRCWSIALRLTLLYTLCAAVTLAATVAILIGLLGRDLGEDEFYFVADRIHMIKATLQRYGDNPVLLDHEVLQANGAADHDRRYVFYARILDERGRVMIETAGMAAIIRAADFPPPALPDSAGWREDDHRWQAPDGRYFVLLSSWANNGETGMRRLIQVALDETEEKVLLTQFQHQTYAVLALATLLFAGLGIFVARKGMRPLADIAGKAERITATHLNERMPSERLPAELVPLAESFNRMLVRLEVSFERIACFSSDIAHELRAPLHNLMGQTEVALTQDRPAEEYREILESNLEECNRLTHMVNGLLFLARAENPQMQIERTTFDVREELDQVSEFHQVVAEEREITLHARGEAQVSADRSMFRRALTNLVANALRYTAAQGRITLAVATRQDGWIEVAVADNGCGIAGEHLPRLFDRLYRPDRGHTPNDTGTGLGLAIVKSIMDLHGGQVTVQSAPGLGSTFTLLFPAASPAGGASGITVPAP